jgi:hypothetical protein
MLAPEGNNKGQQSAAEEAKAGTKAVPAASGGWSEPLLACTPCHRICVIVVMSPLLLQVQA